jgi:uncharacterized protein
VAGIDVRVLYVSRRRGTGSLRRDFNLSFRWQDLGFRLAGSVVVLLICIGAPFFEELYFRGLVQGRLETRLGAASGIALTSLLFGAAHLIAWQGPWTLVYAWAVAASGLVLGLMRHVSGRLGAPMAAHAFFNAQVMAIVVLLS